MKAPGCRRRARLDRLRRERANVRLADELDAIARDCAALPVRDAGPADEILGYDEHGPRGGTRRR